MSDIDDRLTADLPADWRNNISSLPADKKADAIRAYLGLMMILDEARHHVRTLMEIFRRQLEADGIKPTDEHLRALAKAEIDLWPDAPRNVAAAIAEMKATGVAPKEIRSAMSWNENTYKKRARR